ncbi:MAG: hypothetical protein ACKVJA_04965, partial [Flavobacteriales bacterium]
GYNFVVEKNYDYKSEVLPKTIVKFNSLKKIAKQYQSKIQIEYIEKESNILEISILEEDQKKGVKFLNALVANYINNDIENRKVSYLKTVDFIHKEIELIKDSLSIIEITLQDYKNTHQIADINLKTQNIYAKISQLETELSTYKYQDKYYLYLEDYINNGDGLERVIAPSTYGINNSTLSELIKQLVNIQLEKNVLIDGGQINNPSISDFDLQIIQLSSNIKELINNSKQTNLIIIQDLNSRILLEESDLNHLPIDQRELLNIERIQKTSETLYTFLLQKKSEAEITASAITSNIHHEDPSEFFSVNPVLPKVSQVYSIALLIGIFFPFFILLLLDIINDKIRSRIDLEKITDIEIIGILEEITLLKIYLQI